MALIATAVMQAAWVLNDPYRIPPLLPAAHALPSLLVVVPALVINHARDANGVYHAAQVQCPPPQVAAAAIRGMWAAHDPLARTVVLPDVTAQGGHVLQAYPPLRYGDQFPLISVMAALEGLRWAEAARRDPHPPSTTPGYTAASHCRCAPPGCIPIRGKLRTATPHTNASNR